MKYPFVVYFTQVEEHQFWIAECKALKGCVGQGDTIEEAISELETNEEEWLKTAEEYDIPIPEIPIEEQIDYSGKFTVRVSPYVHRMAAELAKKNSISLNQYVNDAIVAQNAAFSTTDYIIPKVKEVIKALNMVIDSSLSMQTNQGLQVYTIHNTKSRSYANKSYASYEIA